MYFGLEVIQKYACADNWPCGSALPLAREFLWGDPERYPEPVAMIRHRFDSVVIETSHYLHDVLGSVVGLVNEAGTLVERYNYDPYGKPLIEKWNAQTSTWQSSAEATSGLPYSPTGNPFMWTGHRYEAAAGLYHTLFRFYDPVLGRWLQRDPIEYEAGSINLYEYVRSAPLTWLDPLGRSPADVRKRLKELCANAICPQKALRTGFSKDGREVCTHSDSRAYADCMRDCQAEADAIVDCLSGVVSSANRGRGAICTNINSYFEFKLRQQGDLTYFFVRAFRPIRVKDGKKGRHVVTGISSEGGGPPDVVVDSLDWNNRFPPNLELEVLEPNEEGFLEDTLPSQNRERHHPYGPPFTNTENPPPWEKNPGIFPP